MGNTIEIITGVPLVSLSGAYFGSWLSMASLVIQGKMNPRDDPRERDLMHSLVFRSMVIGLILSVIVILQEYHVDFPTALGFKQCANIFLLTSAISGIHAVWFLFVNLRKQ